LEKGLSKGTNAGKGAKEREAAAGFFWSNTLGQSGGTLTVQRCVRSKKSNGPVN